MLAVIDVMRLARDVKIYEVDVETGEIIYLRRRPIPQLKTLRQSVFVYTPPFSQNPQAFAVITSYNGKIGLEVSKCGANEMHVVFRGTEIGVLPLSTEPDVPNLGYLPIADLLAVEAE